MGPTEAQLRYLGAIQRLSAMRGYPCTTREIADELGVGSTNAVQQMLQRLERDGFLTRDRKVARSLLLTTKAFLATGGRHG